MVEDKLTVEEIENIKRDMKDFTNLYDYVCYANYKDWYWKYEEEDTVKMYNNINLIQKRIWDKFKE